MSLSELKSTVPGFSDKGHPEKIKILGWYLHVYEKKETFQPSDIRLCYERLHDTPPSSFGGYFSNLVSQKLFIRTGNAYRLSGTLRDQYAQAYTPSGYKIQVTAMLRGLPSRVPDVSERTYLAETLICYENGAFRAAVVMAWNLAYHHLCNYVITKRLADFNARWLIKLPGQHKNGAKQIVSLDDFMEQLKEAEVVSICKDAGIITKDIWKIMEEKLGKRNSAAHASSVTIGQLQTDAFIVDLVENVVLKVF